MICPNCGKEITDDARFCPYCGTKTIEEEAAELAEKAVEEAATAADGIKEAAVIGTAAALEAAELDAEAKAAEAVSSAEDKAAEAAEDAEDKAAEAAEDAEAKVAEAADNAEAAVAAADTAAEAAPAESKPKKKSILPIIIVAILLLAGVGGYFIYNNLPATKSGKLIKQADAYIAENKFEDALAAVAQAKEFTPDNAAVFDTYDKIFEKECQQYINEKGNIIDFKAIDTYVDAAKIVPEYNTKYLNKASELLKTIIDRFMTDTNTENITKLVAVLKSYSQKGVPGLATGIASLEARATDLERDAKFKEFANMLKGYADKQDYKMMLGAVYANFVSVTDFYQKVIKPASGMSSNFPLITSIDGTDKKVGIYYKSGTYFVYYGGYDASGKRSGDGIWLPVVTGGLVGNTYNYTFVGQWANDKPNGENTSYLHIKTSSSDNEYTIKVNTKDGRYDGEAIYTFSTGDVYKATFIDGMPQAIKTDEKGRVIYGYNQDNSKILVGLTGPAGVLGTD